MNCTSCQKELFFNEKDNGIDYFACNLCNVHVGIYKNSCLNYLLTFNCENERYFLEGRSFINVTILGKWLINGPILGKSLIKLNFIPLSIDENMLENSFKTFNRIKNMMVFI